MKGRFRRGDRVRDEEAIARRLKDDPAVYGTWSGRQMRSNADMVGYCNSIEIVLFRFRIL